LVGKVRGGLGEWDWVKGGTGFSLQSKSRQKGLNLLGGRALRDSPSAKGQRERHRGALSLREGGGEGDGYARKKDGH